MESVSQAVATTNVTTPVLQEPHPSKKTKRSPSAEDTCSSQDGDGNTVTSSAASVATATPPPLPVSNGQQQQEQQQEQYPCYHHHHQDEQQQQLMMYPQQHHHQGGGGEVVEYTYNDPYYSQQQHYNNSTNAEYQYHQDQYQEGYNHHQQAPLPPAPRLCYGCGMKSEVFGSGFCSRRCSWLCNNQCPHCGKHKEERNPGGNNQSYFLYCSRHCANQSAQANWCSFCAVCQNTISGFCSNMQCRGSSHAAAAASMQYGSSSSSGCGGYGYTNNQAAIVPQLALGGKSSGNGCYNGKYFSKMECRLLNSSEVSRSGLPGVFSSLFSNGLGSRIVTAVKLTACAPQRRRYLSYRSIVENQMSAMGVPKYGHGGEGNEQRRYFGLPLRCSLGAVPATPTTGSDASPPMPPSVIGGGGLEQQQEYSQQQATRLRTCRDPSCHVCQVMSQGFEMSNFGTASHYCNTTVTAASQYLDASPRTNLRAIIVARVVVGNPEVHVVDGAHPTPAVRPPQDPLSHHSLIFTTNYGENTTFDGTYVFSDEAVDPQYLVLFE